MGGQIHGLVVPAITPKFDSSIDLQSLTNLLELVIDGGVDSIFILGTTGEFQYLSLEEKRRIIEHASGRIRQRVPLMVGISAPTSDETLALIKLSEEYEAQALVLAPMFGWGKPSEQIESVIRISSLPVLLYNNPAIHRGESLPFLIVEEFASCPEVAGIKDSSGDWEYFMRLLELQSPDFAVLQGRETLILSSLQAGAMGIVAAVAGVNPVPFKEILLHQEQEAMDRILELKAEINGFSNDYIQGVKQKLAAMNIIRECADP
jgi:4-hydroxy-tetrahydrodipicolinate synthase